MAGYERMSPRERLHRAVTDAVDGAVVLLVVGILFAILGTPSVTKELLGLRMVTFPTLLFELFIHFGLQATIAWFGWRLLRSSFTAEERWLATGWALGGFTALAVIVTWAYVDDLTTVGATAEYLHGLQVYGSLGGVFGAVAGVNRAHAAQNKRLAELAADQRESLAFLHRLLRHDIRNGMTVIDGYAGLLESHVEPSGEAALAAIEQRSRQVFELLDEAGTVVESVTTDPAFEPVSLELAVSRAVDAATATEPDATVLTDIPTDLTVSADHLFGQAVENLLRNAIEHSHREAPTVQVTAHRRDANVELRVADDGPGIPPERRERVFSLGERGPESEGDGIGLYIVSRLAERYGGSIRVEENEPAGSVFVLSLPAA